MAGTILYDAHKSILCARTTYLERSAAYNPFATGLVYQADLECPFAVQVPHLKVHPRMLEAQMFRRTTGLSC